MTQDLVPQDITAGPLATPETFASVVKGGDYLPRFQLFGSNSNACKEGKIAIAHYGLTRDDVITDLGSELDIVLISWRSKAIDSGDGDALIIDYKPEITDGEITNPIFKRIVDMSNVKDSGCMYGPEYLIWIPSVGQFATWHMNSKTARREAKNVQPLLGKAATLKSRLIDNGKYKWHGPVVIPCSTQLDMPSEEVIREQWTKFQNPPESEVEVAPDDDSRAR